MSTLLWLPRPLVFEVIIAGQKTLCVQSNAVCGVNTCEYQKLFPLRGDADELEDLHAIDQRFWRAMYVGTVGDYKDIENNRFKIVTGLSDDSHIVILVANECWNLDLEIKVFQLVCVVEGGVLYEPAYYYNSEILSELPTHMFDSCLQRKLQELYLLGASNTEEQMCALLDVFGRELKFLYLGYLENIERFNRGWPMPLPSNIG